VPFALEVLQNAQVVERVDVACDQLRQCALRAGDRATWPAAARLCQTSVQVFEDSPRLSQHPLAMLQHGTSPADWLRGTGAVLLAAIAQQVHRHEFVAEPFRFRPIRTR
jgi:hypothetical protein